LKNRKRQALLAASHAATKLNGAGGAYHKLGNITVAPKVFWAHWGGVWVFL
jgi:hypothetical protein